MTWAHLGAAAGGVLAVMGVGGALLIGGGFVSPASEVKAQAAKLEQTQSVVHRLATEQAVQGERVRNIEAMIPAPMRNPLILLAAVFVVSMPLLYTSP